MSILAQAQVFVDVLGLREHRSQCQNPTEVKYENSESQIYQLNVQCLLNIGNHLKRQIFLPF